MMKSYNLLVLFCLLCCACEPDPRRDIRAYYFPANDLLTGMVYEYDLAKGDTTAPEFWYFRSFQRDSGLFLAATYYDQRYQIGQISREKLTESGAIARDYFLYEPDTASGQVIPITAQIASPDIFPFQVRDSLGFFLFKLSYQLPNDTTSTISLIRNRFFRGDAPDFVFKGKKYPCVRFGVREVIGNTREGTLEIEGSGEEWYAKGLGLVYYYKSFDRGRFVREYRLRDIFPMAELERRAR